MSQDAAIPNKLWYLKHVRLFSGLSPVDLQKMERMALMQEVKRRQPIYLPGDPSHTVYLLKKRPRQNFQHGRQRQGGDV